MACTGYLPRFKLQLDGSVFGGFNCTCASAAMAADYDSCGKINVSGAQVRLWTGDRSGGTNLAQVDEALRSHVSVDLDTRYKYSWTDFAARINKGEGAILQGWYAPIRDSRYSGSPTFGQNHAIFVAPGWIGMDPLADGRRAGIYKYHGEVYPQSLLKDFAGRLNIGGSTYRRLGNGLVYAAFTRDNSNPTNYKVIIRPTPPSTRLAYFQYELVNGVIPANGRTTHYTGGFTASCTTSRLYSWPAKDRHVSLVLITSGSSAGKYVESKFAHEA